MDTEALSLLSIVEVCARTRISKAHYYRLRGESRGPRETRLGKRKVFVSEAALTAWPSKATHS